MGYYTHVQLFVFNNTESGSIFDSEREDLYDGYKEWHDVIIKMCHNKDKDFVDCGYDVARKLLAYRFIRALLNKIYEDDTHARSHIQDVSDYLYDDGRLYIFSIKGVTIGKRNKEGHYYWINKFCKKYKNHIQLIKFNDEFYCAEMLKEKIK